MSTTGRRSARFTRRDECKSPSLNNTSKALIERPGIKYSLRQVYTSMQRRKSHAERVADVCLLLDDDEDPRGTRINLRSHEPAVKRYMAAIEVALEGIDSFGEPEHNDHIGSHRSQNQQKTEAEKNKSILIPERSKADEAQMVADQKSEALENVYPLPTEDKVCNECTEDTSDQRQEDSSFFLQLQEKMSEDGLDQETRHWIEARAKLERLERTNTSGTDTQIDLAVDTKRTKAANKMKNRYFEALTKAVSEMRWPKPATTVVSGSGILFNCAKCSMCRQNIPIVKIDAHSETCIAEDKKNA